MDEVVSLITKLSGGVIGSANSLVDLAKYCQDNNRMEDFGYCLARLNQSVIKGQYIWVLVKDISQFDYGLVIYLLKNVPIERLEKACIEDHRNGKKFIIEYILAYERL